MKRGELKVTCLLCGSEEFVLVVVLNVEQRWVLNCSPWQMCVVKAKVMVTIFDLAVLIQLWCYLCGTLSNLVPSPLGLGVSHNWVVNVGQLIMGSQERRFRMIAFQFIIPAMGVMSIPYIFHHAGFPCQEFYLCSLLGEIP